MQSKARGNGRNGEGKDDVRDDLAALAGTSQLAAMPLVDAGQRAEVMRLADPHSERVDEEQLLALRGLAQMTEAPDGQETDDDDEMNGPPTDAELHIRAHREHRRRRS
jgi:hypothetical protein